MEQTANISVGLGFPIEDLIQAKGRGVLETVSPDNLIDDENTVVTDLASTVFAKPKGDKFLVIARSNNPYKEKQLIVIMSKVVLKKLRADHNAPDEPVFANSFKGKEEFQKKWSTRSSR